MSGTELPAGAAAHMDGALAGDAGAQAQLDAIYRAAFPDEAPAETGPPRQPDRAPGAAAAEGGTSVPPGPAGAPRAAQEPAAGAPARTSRDGAQARIAALQSDPAFMQRCADGDAEALAQLEGLYRIAWPGSADEGSQGGPNGPDGYTFAPSPDGFEPAPEHREAAVATFQALRVSPNDARELERMFLAAASRNLSPEAHNAMAADTMAALARELGGDEAAAALVSDARAYLREAERTWPGLRAYVDEHGVGNDLALVKALGKLARARKGSHW